MQLQSLSSTENIMTQKSKVFNKILQVFNIFQKFTEINLDGREVLRLQKIIIQIKRLKIRKKTVISTYHGCPRACLQVYRFSTSTHIKFRMKSLAESLISSQYGESNSNSPAKDIKEKYKTNPT